MVEPSLAQVVEICQAFGPAGLVMVLWWFSERKTEKMVDQHHKDTAITLTQYQEDMKEQRKMYENNALLCEAYMRISEDLKDTVILNTAGYNKLKSAIESNQFCPLQRFRRTNPGVIEG